MYYIILAKKMIFHYQNILLDLHMHYLLIALGIKAVVF